MVSIAISSTTLENGDRNTSRRVSNKPVFVINGRPVGKEFPNSPASFHYCGFNGRAANLGHNARYHENFKKMAPEGRKLTKYNMNRERSASTGHYHMARCFNTIDGKLFNNGTCSFNGKINHFPAVF